MMGLARLIAILQDVMVESVISDLPRHVNVMEETAGNWDASIEAAMVETVPPTILPQMVAFPLLAILRSNEM